jgi:hypothetical protein
MRKNTETRHGKHATKPTLATLLALLALLSAGQARAAVTMSIIDPNSGAPGNNFCEYSGLNASLDSHTLISGGDWIGIYQFNVAPGGDPVLNNPFYAICLSPQGVLTDGNHSYTELTFAQANPGLNPSSWQWNHSVSNPQYWGAQNAEFLYATYASAIISGNSSMLTALGLTHGNGADQGTALALALYDVLYNSTGYGNNLTLNRFTLVNANANVTADYYDILSGLSSWNTNDLAVGYVLQPSDTSQQDMILLSTELPNGGTVPEPTTVLAGALLLLPVGVGLARRSIRKR